MNVRRHLGRLRRGLRNWLVERRDGPDTRFVYDYHHLEDYMRVNFCSVREVGLRMRCMISERIVEYPLVFRNITKPHSRILDIGSSESFLPYQLASLGHFVVASDLFPPSQQWRKKRRLGRWVVHADWEGYVLKHRNLHFVREDATRLGHKDETFDHVTAISTIEHIGCYGTRVADPTVPGLRAMSEIHRVLKREGSLLFSVPYGNGGESERNWLLQIIFDEDLMTRYLKSFSITARHYYVYRDYAWEECGEQVAKSADCSTRTTGMCFVVARKD